MPLLAATLYDPAVNATKSAAALLAMTAIDTTNLRLTFTVPANGSVLVRIRVGTKGGASSPMLLLGCLEGATLRGRQAPMIGKSGSQNAVQQSEACYVVTGLTPGASLTWDAAYGVEFAVTSAVISIGGPNDATTSNNAGGAAFEIWETTNLLAATLYDPAALQSKSTAAGLALTAFDTTNLRLTFTAPSSGRVIVKIRVAEFGGTSPGQKMLGVLDGATVRARMTPIGGGLDFGTSAATSYFNWELVSLVTGLAAGSSFTWDAAYGVEGVVASANLSYGGPDDTTQTNAGGGLAYEIWAA